MKLVVLTSAALICTLALAPAVSAAQATKAAGTQGAAKKDAVAATATPPPPSPELVRARMRPPVKGTAYIELIKGQAKVVGGELRNVHKVKNTSGSPIVGLRVDEYFYIGQKEAAVGTGRMRTAIAPGEIAEIVTAAEPKTGLTASQLKFTHANGDVKVTAVKKFSEDKK
ncbi:MAG TPA: hypothetical protein VKH34_06330 [Vicinamibacterales bacterium]|jgi:hypothetical protein|nr:hypothetical protein [Vicinamibacterales bacterium]